MNVAFSPSIYSHFSIVNIHEEYSCSTAQSELGTHVHHTGMLSIDCHLLFTSSSRVIVLMIEMTHKCTRIMQTNLVNVSLVTNINRSLKMLLNTNLTAECVRTFINGFDDTLVDNYNKVTLSMEPRKQMVTLNNNHYCLICRHINYMTPEVLQLLANQMLMCYYCSK